MAQFSALRAAKAVIRAPLAWHARRQRRLSRDHAYLAVGAIFKDEARYLSEWLTFHRIVGVEHFYLYNNNSSDCFRDVLAKFDCVTLVDWPSRNNQQRSAYEDCARRFGSRCRWLAFIDIDEFLFSPDAVDVRKVFAQFEGYPGVFVKSPFFGTAGIKRVPDSIIGSLMMRSATRLSGKSIVDPRSLRNVRCPHRPAYHGANPLPAEPSMDVLRLNHYWGRSLEGLKEKVARGDVWGGKERVLDWHLAFDAELNEVKDTTILRVIEQMKR